MVVTFTNIRFRNLLVAFQQRVLLGLIQNQMETFMIILHSKSMLHLSLCSHSASRLGFEIVLNDICRRFLVSDASCLGTLKISVRREFLVILLILPPHDASTNATQLWFIMGD